MSLRARLIAGLLVLAALGLVLLAGVTYAEQRHGGHRDDAGDESAAQRSDHARGVRSV